jgi:DNA-binding PadR family transcriptional regulator
VSARVFILKPEVKPNLQERTLKAFLDLAILCALAERPMTGYEINRIFLKKYRIFVGPSTIYSKLASIERNEWIECVSNRAGRVYGLTEQGRRITLKMMDITREIQGFVRIMLKCRN